MLCVTFEKQHFGIMAIYITDVYDEVNVDSQKTFINLWQI